MLILSGRGGSGGSKGGEKEAVKAMQGDASIFVLGWGVSGVIETAVQ